MFLSVRCVIFFLWCVAIGLGTALIWNFLFIYLEQLDKAFEGCDSSIKTLEGLVMGIQCFGGELPFFFLSGSPSVSLSGRTGAHGDRLLPYNVRAGNG